MRYVKRSGKPLEETVRKGLKSKRSVRRRASLSFIEHPFKWDLGVLAVLLTVYLLFWWNGIYYAADYDTLTDLLTEMVSASIGSGGFILAAMAIMAGIRSGVKVTQQAASGEEYFYNSSAFAAAITVYSKGCLVYLAVFLSVVGVRMFIDTIPTFYTQLFIAATVVVMTTTFLRCIYILYQVLTLPRSK